jgi:hypothetical protein
MVNNELANKLVSIIKKAQPTTSFSGNIIRYNNQIFYLPLPPAKKQSTTQNRQR